MNFVSPRAKRDAKVVTFLKTANFFLIFFDFFPNQCAIASQQHRAHAEHARKDRDDEEVQQDVGC